MRSSSARAFATIVLLSPLTLGQEGSGVLLPAPLGGGKSMGMESVWALPGTFHGLAVDPSKRVVIGADWNGRATVVKADGTLARTFVLRDGGMTTSLRLSRVADNEWPSVIAFGIWGQTVTACDFDGDMLWSHRVGHAVDDVWTGDLNGDEVDEVVIGYNGAGGVRVLDSQGNETWTFDQIGNVWHVCVGDVDAQRGNEVVTTSARGVVHVFDREGELSRTLNPSEYVTMVRVTGDGLILASGGEKLSALKFDGGEEWAMDLGEAGHLTSAVVAEQKPWIALGFQGGRVLVVDVSTQQVVASANYQSLSPQMAWLPRDGDTPLLVIATGEALEGVRIDTGE